MYRITDQQTEFILDDIRARGVELEDLQANLLDHVCCIIEQELEENGDFEECYAATIRRFYKEELREIQEETISLLTNKNYYVMKKIMIYSGVFAAAALSAGILLKYMHAKGAGVLMIFGIVAASLIFIPLLFVLKVKEKQSGIDRLLVGLGTLSAMAIAMGILFKVMHWPGANVLAVSSPAILILAFLPIYLITGIRNPERKVNTIVTSILIIVGCGLFFSLTLTPQSSRMVSMRAVKDYMRNEAILAIEQKQLVKYWKADTANTQTAAQSKKIYDLCEELKKTILEATLNSTGISEDDKISGPAAAGKKEVTITIADYSAHDFFDQHIAASAKVSELRKMVTDYNAGIGTDTSFRAIPADANIIDEHNISAAYKLSTALNDIVQIQMVLLQNQRSLAML